MIFSGRMSPVVSRRSVKGDSGNEKAFLGVSGRYPGLCIGKLGAKRHLLDHPSWGLVNFQPHKPSVGTI